MGAEVDDALTAWRKTALMAAAYGGHACTVRHLVESGAALERGNKHGDTALMAAAAGGHAEAAGVLLASGADANTRDHDNGT
eukprot:953207-Prorocentrum_minimum.AAC.1